jgi:hypothetical protein
MAARIAVAPRLLRQARQARSVFVPELNCELTGPILLLVVFKFQ